MSSIYNTTGKVVGETPSSGNAGKAANPKLEVLDALQLLLDLVGMVPGAGAIPDLLNGCISLARGDFFVAALSVFSAIPAAGDVVGAGKIIKNGEKYVEALKLVESKVLPKLPAKMAKPLKEFIDKAKDKLDELMGKGKTAEKAPDAPNEKPKTGEGDEAAKKGDTQVKTRTAPQANPKCFGGDKTKEKPGEYDRQLQEQEDAINKMSVEEYLKNRDRWDQLKRVGTAAEQAAARAKAVMDMAIQNRDTLRTTGGMSAAEAATKGMEQAQKTAKGMDILHSPDLSAGGSASGTTGLGDKGVNRSIGSNWGQNQDASGVGDRVRDMDKSAKSVPEADRANTKMNVKLKRCP